MWPILKLSNQKGKNVLLKEIISISYAFLTRGTRLKDSVDSFYCEYLYPNPILILANRLDFIYCMWEAATVGQSEKGDLSTF